MVSHEIGQWCVFPNFAEMKKYTGVLKPRNFELFREILPTMIWPIGRDFLVGSGKLQALCLADIEAQFALPVGWLAVLDLHDFPVGKCSGGAWMLSGTKRGIFSAESTGALRPTVLCADGTLWYTRNQGLPLIGGAHFGHRPYSVIPSGRPGMP